MNVKPEQAGQVENDAQRKLWTTPQVIVAESSNAVAKSYTTQPGDFIYLGVAFGS